MKARDDLSDSQKSRATQNIEISHPKEYSRFLLYILTRETAYWHEKVKAMVRKNKNLSEIRLALDSTKKIAALESRIDSAWDDVSEAILNFINSPTEISLRYAFQDAYSKLYDLSGRAIEEINSAYDLSPEIKSRLQSKVDALVDVQVGDLQKAIVLQYQSSGASEYDAEVAKNLVDALADVVDGPMTDVGSLIVSGQTINEGRDSAADDISDDVESFTFQNDEPVTKICQELNGRTFSVDDPDRIKFSPPLHYNCDSYWIINLKQYKDNPQIDNDKLILSKKAQGQINLSDCCDGSLVESPVAKYLMNEWREIRP